MPDPKLVELAMRLQLLGVSNSGVIELLSFPPERIEAQLSYLPYRKAKRPEAFIIEAVRSNYSPPKEFYYASPQAQSLSSESTVDQDAQHPA